MFESYDEFINEGRSKSNFRLKDDVSLQGGMELKFQDEKSAKSFASYLEDRYNLKKSKDYTINEPDDYIKTWYIKFEGIRDDLQIELDKEAKQTLRKVNGKINFKDFMSGVPARRKF